MSKTLRADPAYFRALGLFVDQFAQVEGALFRFLSVFAGVDHEIARAILSGARVDAACSFLRRIPDVKGRAKNPRNVNLPRVLEQLLIINNVRNDILHYGTMITEGGARVTSNIDRALHVCDREKP